MNGTVHTRTSQQQKENVYNQQAKQKMSKSTAASDAWCVCASVYADVLDSDGGNNSIIQLPTRKHKHTYIAHIRKHYTAQPTKYMIINKYLF